MDEYSTPKEEIEQCLNCPAEECWNCIHWGREPTAKRCSTSRLDVNKLIRLYNAGEDTGVMARSLHIREDLLIPRLRNMGLPYKDGDFRPLIGYEFFAQLPEVFQAYLIWERKKR